MLYKVTGFHWLTIALLFITLKLQRFLGNHSGWDDLARFATILVIFFAVWVIGMLMIIISSIVKTKKREDRIPLVHTIVSVTFLILTIIYFTGIGHFTFLSSPIYSAVYLVVTIVITLLGIMDYIQMKK